MRNAVLVPVLVIVLTGCSGCIPARVRESAIEGETLSRRAVELLESGQATLPQLQDYVRASAKKWEAHRRLLEE